MVEEAQKGKIEVKLAEESSRYRKLSGTYGLIARILAIGLPIYSFFYIMNLFSHFKLFIYSGTHNAIFLAIVLTLFFSSCHPISLHPGTRFPGMI